MSEQPKFEPLLSDKETLIITRITQADAPYNQRAQALLAINSGKSEEEAGEAAGLRATQVKYIDCSLFKIQGWRETHHFTFLSR
jgi:hypothetical protein